MLSNLHNDGWSPASSRNASAVSDRVRCGKCVRPNGVVGFCTPMRVGAGCSDPGSHEHHQAATPRPLTVVQSLEWRRRLRTSMIKERPAEHRSSNQSNFGGAHFLSPWPCPWYLQWPPARRSAMSLQDHIGMLRTRHAALDIELANEERRPLSKRGCHRSVEAREAAPEGRDRRPRPRAHRRTPTPCTADYSGLIVSHGDCDNRRQRRLAVGFVGVPAFCPKSTAFAN
jgi:hypothetical protein